MIKKFSHHSPQLASSDPSAQSGSSSQTHSLEMQCMEALHWNWSREQVLSAVDEDPCRKQAKMGRGRQRQKSRQREGELGKEKGRAKEREGEVITPQINQFQKEMSPCLSITHKTRTCKSEAVVKCVMC